MLNNMYPPHHLGGYEQSCRDVVERWRADGHEVLVLTTDARVPGVADPPSESRDDIRRDLRFYWRDHRITDPSPFRRFAMERSNLRALRMALADLQPHVASVWHMGAMSMGLMTALERRGIPMVLVLCDDWMIYGPEVDGWARALWQRPRLARAIERVTGLPASAPTMRDASCCFISEWTKQRAIQRSVLPVNNAAITYNGIDSVDFPVAQRADRPWTWSLLYAGRVEERKGVHVAIRALRHLPDEATLLIDGRADPNYLEHLRDVAKNEHVADRVTFAESARSSLRDRYAAADAVLHPVLWDEPFGLVPVEAMASGTCVVATATGGAVEYLVHDANALVVERDDPRAIAEALHRLASDPPLRERLQRGGLYTAEELTVDRFTSLLTEWHRFAAHQIAGAPPEREPIPAVLARSGVVPVERET